MKGWNKRQKVEWSSKVVGMVSSLAAPPPGNAYSHTHLRPLLPIRPVLVMHNNRSAYPLATDPTDGVWSIQRSTTAEGRDIRF